MSFSSIGLCPSLVQGIRKTGYDLPTEIQRKAIPAVLSGKDIIGCAPTGTGKTAAFILPMLDRLLRTEKKNNRNPRALIVTPTRELTQQIEDSIRTYGVYAGLKPLSLYGGVPIDSQLQCLKKGVDIVVATPGRLLDHIDRKSIQLSEIQILVLDEADRMYDMGFIRAVRTIVSKLPVQRQTLLFSATMSREIRTLVAEILQNPQTIEVGERFTPVSSVEQHFYAVSRQAKMDLLSHILDKQAVDAMLVFSRTKHGADKIAARLDRSGIRTTAIHSNRSQAQRQRALNGFKRREFKVLVATDIVARGIDVDGISHVVNFDTPVYAQDYIHRIGRTGRAEAKGVALTFVSGDERKYFNKIEQISSGSLELKLYPGFSGNNTDGGCATPECTSSAKGGAGRRSTGYAYKSSKRFHRIYGAR